MPLNTATKRVLSSEGVARSAFSLLWRSMLLGACAGGMGWGIRGQYGHETGAMIAGLLVSATLVLFWRPDSDLLTALRAVALCTAAVALGGSMTYGQTIGLTQNPEVTGNAAAFTWGMLGLSLKGTIWIGFAGVFLGMGLSGTRYRAIEMAALLAALAALTLAGIWLFNEPYDPANRVLPRAYFSANWRWYPEAGGELKPRREIWGGLGLALIVLFFYVTMWRRDRLALRLGLWGCLGGLGFPLGQTLQASRAWHPELFNRFLGAELDSLINWWNVMEITFGAVWGAALALGLWHSRTLIGASGDRPIATISTRVEVFLLLLQLPLLWLLEFGAIGWLDAVGDLGMAQSVIPLIGILGGRYWAAWMTLPVTAFPIIIKTLRHTGIASAGHELPIAIVGCAVLLWVATELMCRTRNTRQCLASLLLIVVWLYWTLNFALFDWPWVWRVWTYRTPSGLVFTFCAAVLTWFAIRMLRLEREQRSNGSAFAT